MIYVVIVQILCCGAPGSGTLRRYNTILC